MVFVLSQSKHKAHEIEVKMLKYRNAESSWQQNSSEQQAWRWLQVEGGYEVLERD